MTHLFRTVYVFFFLCLLINACNTPEPLQMPSWEIVSASSHPTGISSLEVFASPTPQVDAIQFTATPSPKPTPSVITTSSPLPIHRTTPVPAIVTILTRVVRTIQAVPDYLTALISQENPPHWDAPTQDDNTDTFVNDIPYKHRL